LPSAKPVSRTYLIEIQTHARHLLAPKVGLWASWLFIFLQAWQEMAAQGFKKVKHFDPNGLIVKEIYFTSDKEGKIKNGPFTAFYANGQAKTKGQYKNNQAEGIWERFFENGQLKSTYSYRNGNLEGYGKLYFENGKPAQEGHYAANLEDSTWKYYFESGKLKSQGSFKKGKQQGLWRFLHEDSTLKATAFMNDGKGLYKEFYSNGNLKMEGYLKNGLSDSIWKYFYETGQIKAIGKERGGEREGYWNFYHTNGILGSEGHFQKNQKFGRWKYYHENGNLSSEGDLENNDKEGVWKFFFPSGSLMGEGNFVKGNGDYQEFYDNGKIKLKGKIVDDLYQGTWTFYFDDGGLEGECEYVNGYGQYLGYYANGGIKMRGQMHNGQKIGSWDLMGRDGKLIGHYKTFYDMIQPNIPAEPKVKKPRTDSSHVLARSKAHTNPAFFNSKKKWRNYISKVNELRGFIVGINPFATALSSFPISIEYFFHDRLGLELMFTIYRQPFFVNHSEELENRRLYTTGNSIDFRQKLYSQDVGRGSFYIGQELRITNFSHKLYVVENIDSMVFRQNFKGEETKVELSILVGNRFFQHFNKHKSLTLDLYCGIGFGYRYSRIPERLLTYDRIKTNTLTVPFRLGFNFGFLF
jgi:antitoxin component YwqK of YwqJK toxin-antitoxin module